ncbi:MAG: GIY-YIG nuclease family protein [bacterium]|nr:GIY-YIG nuclease family protein [bacterium]
MPVKPIDYSKTHIYKIVCKDLNIKDCYVGHTTDFIKRKSQHKNTSLNPKYKYHHSLVYQFIRENGGWENFDMVLIKTETCENSLEAKQRERHFIEQLHTTLNTVKRPYATQEENLEKRKQWNEQHVEECRERARTHYYDNRDKKLLQVKTYNEEHKEDKKQYNQQYRETHKDKISIRRSQKLICVCGAQMTFSNKHHHEKTKKHQEYINKNN